MAEGPRRRLQLMSILLIGLVIVLLAQLVQVQIIDHAFYTDWGNEQRERPIAVADPPRGVIRDRNGHLLVGNTVMYSIEADTVLVVDAEAVASAVGGEEAVGVADGGVDLLVGDAGSGIVRIPARAQTVVGMEDELHRDVDVDDRLRRRAERRQQQGGEYG